MTELPPDILRLARQLAEAQGISVAEAIRRAVADSFEAAGLTETDQAARRRMSAEQMLAFGREIAAMPLLDPRSPEQIMDDIASP
ncbi:type II toxin-antitoxin system VapB family antitoxin [Rhodoplanes sp. SY1]|uniref:type II toxin-antitoxin system VapB family antitoxin n=1 Tax=Rhodoplanes sp. SY1 TaxID=3166646 RepID=UPI0038B62CD7